jgi:hypothetical protein
MRRILVIGGSGGLVFDVCYKSSASGQCMGGMSRTMGPARWTGPAAVRW